ncbi:MAG: response regulator, partial [Acidobacteriota bacterium]
MTDKAKQTVLIVDDQAAIRRQLASVLEDDYEVIQASSRKEALAAVEKGGVDVVICDLHMPPNEDDITEGLGVLEGVREFNNQIPVIVVTGDDSRSAAMEVAKRSAYAPLPKPFTPVEIEIMVR